MTAIASFLTELVQEIPVRDSSGEPPGVLIVVPDHPATRCQQRQRKFRVTAYIGKVMVGIDEDHSEQPESGQGGERPDVHRDLPFGGVATVGDPVIFEDV